MLEFRELHEAILAGDARQTTQLVVEALEAGASPLDVVHRGLQASMTVVGEKFSSGEFFVPEMLFAAEAVTEALTLLQADLESTGAQHLGSVVIGTVAGDIHDIGKNLVSMLLRGAGFDVIDLGEDVSSDCFVEAVREYRPTFLAMSALLTTTLPAIGSTLAALEAEGVRDQVRVIIGGAPVTARYAQQVGADGYAPDAGAAVLLCHQLLRSGAEES